MMVSVIGAGSFGTAIAQTISASVSEVVLFGRSEELLRRITANHINYKYYPQVPLSLSMADARAPATATLAIVKQSVTGAS
jgi:glycerol-3-phosphate dehydrogenase